MPFSVTIGVTRGSILGPVLLNSFTSDVDRGSEGTLSERTDGEGLEGGVSV